MQLAEM